MEIKIKKSTLKKGILLIVGLLSIAIVYAFFFKETGTATTLGANVGQAANAYSGVAAGGCQF